MNHAMAKPARVQTSKNNRIVIVAVLTQIGADPAYLRFCPIVSEALLTRLQRYTGLENVKRYDAQDR